MQVVPDIILGPFVCDQLGISPAELGQLGYETVSVHMGYLEGQALARWASENPRPKHGVRES